MLNALVFAAVGLFTLISMRFGWFI
ncbi:stress response membrane protein YncL [Escherichia coli]|nr:stress response membrane protein YncL [Escherichia coli]